MVISLEMFVVWLLVAFVIGLIWGVNLGSPRY
jgi:hypothetical protein